MLPLPPTGKSPTPVTVLFRRAIRLLWLCLLGLLASAPARADDVSAAGRGVVRIVTIAIVDGEVVGFGHGSGFAIAPNRIVTNAHVVEAAARYPGNVAIGVVPSAGDRSYQGRLIAVDPARDLALIEFSGTRLPPLTLYAGPASEGDLMVALGYPGNVDVATAQSMGDFIRPLSPVRSQGIYSGTRELSGTQVLLHTANIARGNSGGPLLDRCGRVVGVNSAVTRGEDGDSSFGFAIADAELTRFLSEAGQRWQSVGVPCQAIEDRLAADSAAEANALQAQQAAAASAAARAREARQTAIEEARAANLTTRENVMGAAALLLVLGAMAVGWGALLRERVDRRGRMVIAGGVALMLVAAVVFLLRPRFDPADVADAPPAAAPTSASSNGRMLCRFDPARSRVTVSATADVVLDDKGDGCINGRTQYAEDGHGGWTRILVPDEEATVSVLTWQPGARTYTNTRYLLDDRAMTEARRLRKSVAIKACTADPAARANLAGQQSAIRAALPAKPNEKLVYACTAAR